MWVVHKGRELDQTSICKLRPVLKFREGWLGRNWAR